MQLERMKEYRLEDLLLQVRLQYDEASERYLEMIPDFEDDPVFTASGRPVVSAVQDACIHAASRENHRCIDCGDCRFFEIPHPDSLIGICGQPARCTKAYPGKKEDST